MLLANGRLSVINLRTSITYTQKLQSSCMNDNNSIITFENSDVKLKRSSHRHGYRELAQTVGKKGRRT